MRLPRDLSGRELAARLNRYGYQISRQSGSHLRLTAELAEGQHHLTIPAHAELRVGTLHAILGEVAQQLGMPVAELFESLFG
ncbi:MAG TPA: type II toxin-antitoxin system HicA family toxin [Terriglobales bacterium]|nr:type II toxin-antitoxin system HicA family toxin [Terriglobales bacterium]